MSLAHQRLVESGPAVFVGSVGEGLRPSCVRGYGASVTHEKSGRSRSIARCGAPHRSPGTSPSPSRSSGARGSTSSPDYADTPLADVPAVTTLTDGLDPDVRPSVVLLLPTEGAGCPLALTLVPGASPSEADNLADARVLATSSRADCADLPVPVGAADFDGRGAHTLVLAQAADPEDASAGVTWSEVVHPGGALRQLPGTTITGRRLNVAKSVALARLGDVDGDGLDDLTVPLASRPAGQSPKVRLRSASKLAELENPGPDDWGLTLRSEGTWLNRDLDDDVFDVVTSGSEVTLVDEVAGPVPVPDDRTSGYQTSNVLDVSFSIRAFDPDQIAPVGLASPSLQVD